MLHRVKVVGVFVRFRAPFTDTHLKAHKQPQHSMPAVRVGKEGTPCTPANPGPTRRRVLNARREDSAVARASTRTWREEALLSRARRDQRRYEGRFSGFSHLAGGGSAAGWLRVTPRLCWRICGNWLRRLPAGEHATADRSLESTYANLGGRADWSFEHLTQPREWSALTERATRSRAVVGRRSGITSAAEAWDGASAALYR
jgi:hypothetical protein